MNRAIRLLALATALAPAASLGASYDIDPAHSHASFTVKHLVISNVRGEFGKTTGKVSLDEQDLTRSSVEATIDATTIDTRVPDRDNHLKSPDFFDVAKYPTITFRSTMVEPAGQGHYKVLGNLTIKGTTKPVVLEVEGPTPAIKGMKGETRRAAEATTRINRKDFGLNWSKMVEAGPVVGDDVRIELSVEMVKAAQQPKAAAAERAEATK